MHDDTEPHISTATGSILEENLDPETILEKLRDPNYLPTLAEVDQAFGTIYSPEAKSIWDKFCFDEKNPVFELLTQEFITAISEYLIERAIKLGGSETDPLTILEICAGNGRLTHFINQYAQSQGVNVFNVIASDRGQEGYQSDFPVDSVDYRDALLKYNPSIVLASWVPYGVDVTKNIRSNPNVEEYILVGETDDGCCGDDWLTWGNRDSVKPQRWMYEDENGFDSESYDNAMESYEVNCAKAPYEHDGFQRMDIERVSQVQRCRSDYPGSGRHSQTVSFRRES